MIVDTTVQEKAIAHLTDSRLLETARIKLVQAAKDAGINLKQTFAKEGKQLACRRPRTASGSFPRSAHGCAPAICDQASASTGRRPTSVRRRRSSFKQVALRAFALLQRRDAGQQALRVPGAAQQVGGFFERAL